MRRQAILKNSGKIQSVNKDVESAYDMPGMSPIFLTQTQSSWLSILSSSLSTWLSVFTDRQLIFGFADNAEMILLLLVDHNSPGLQP